MFDTTLRKHTGGLQQLRATAQSKGKPHLPSLFGEYLIADVQAVQEWKPVPKRQWQGSRPGRPPVWSSHRQRGRKKRSIASLILGYFGTFSCLILYSAWHDRQHSLQLIQPRRLLPRVVVLRQAMCEGHRDRQYMSRPCLARVCEKSGGVERV